MPKGEETVELKSIKIDYNPKAEGQLESIRIEATASQDGGVPVKLGKSFGINDALDWKPQFCEALAGAINGLIAYKGDQ